MVLKEPPPQQLFKQPVVDSSTARMHDSDVKALVRSIAQRKHELDRLTEEDKADKARLIEWARTQQLIETKSGAKGLRVAGDEDTHVYVSFPSGGIVQQIMGKPAQIAKRIAGEFLDTLFTLRPCKDFRNVVSRMVLEKKISPANGRSLIGLCECDGVPRVIVD